MRRTNKAAALLLCALLGLTLSPGASARKTATVKKPVGRAAVPAGVLEVKRAIQAAYNEQNAAFARRDADGFFSHRTIDYVSVDRHGNEHDGGEQRQSLETLFENTTAAKANTVVQQITLQADGAVVVVREQARLTVVRPGDNRVGHFVFESTSRDFWVKTDDGWECKRSKSMTDRTTINGRPA